MNPRLNAAIEYGPLGVFFITYWLAGIFPATGAIMAATVVAAQRAAETGDGWVSGAVKRVSNLVSLRPVGAVEGDGPGAAVARAEVHLDADDLAGAVAELESLSGEAAAAAADWLAQAKGRLAVDATLDELAATMARRLGLEGG